MMGNWPLSSWPKQSSSFPTPMWVFLESQSHEQMFMGVGGGKTSNWCEANQLVQTRRCSRLCYITKHRLFLFYFIYYYYYYYFFGCIGSSLLHVSFLQLWRARATVCCGARASHCSGFSCCRAWALGEWASVVVAHGLQYLWCMGSAVVARGLQSTGSVVVAHGLSWSAARGIFPDQGSNLCPLHWQADS